MLRIPAAILFVISASFVAEAHAALSANVQGPDIHVSGATPGGRVVFVGSLESFNEDVIQQAELVADSNGTASLTALQPSRSDQVWIIADATTGQYVIAPTYLTPSERGTLSYSGDGLSVRLMNVPVAMFYVLRPGVGMWWAVAANGRASDTSPLDHEIAHPVAQFIPVGSEPKSPSHLGPGDVVFALDLVNYVHEYYVVPVGANIHIPTATTLTSVPNPSMTGSPVTLVASVTWGANDEAPTGTLTFFVDGTASETVVLSAGRGLVQLAPMPAGEHTIVAQFNPAAGSEFTSSLSAVLKHVVEPARRRSVRH